MKDHRGLHRDAILGEVGADTLGSNDCSLDQGIGGCRDNGVREHLGKYTLQSLLMSSQWEERGHEGKPRTLWVCLTQLVVVLFLNERIPWGDGSPVQRLDTSGLRCQRR